MPTWLTAMGDSTVDEWTLIGLDAERHPLPHRTEALGTGLLLALRTSQLHFFQDWPEGNGTLEPRNVPSFKQSLLPHPIFL